MKREKLDGVSCKNEELTGLERIRKYHIKKEIYNNIF